MYLIKFSLLLLLIFRAWFSFFFWYSSDEWLSRRTPKTHCAIENATQFTTISTAKIIQVSDFFFNSSIKQIFAMNHVKNTSPIKDWLFFNYDEMVSASTLLASSLWRCSFIAYSLFRYDIGRITTLLLAT